jgi:hypothetical protein
MRYKYFSEAVATAGAYYMSAITATGIKDELLAMAQQGKPIVLLATNRGAEFPENAPNVVYLKADRVTLDAGQKSWQNDARKSVLKSSIIDINNHQIEEKERNEKVEKIKNLLKLTGDFEE